MLRIWKVSPWYHAELWDYFLQNNCMVIGDWNGTNIGDLSRYANKAALRAKKLSPSAAKQLWSFYGEMAVRDIAIAYGNKCIMGVGKIMGNYYRGKKDDPIKGENYFRNMRWGNARVDISSDKRLYGNPRKSYGLLSRQATIIEVSIDDLNYICATYPVLKKACANLNP